VTTPTDKIGHGYGPTYETIAEIFDEEGRAVRILEVGVADGAGVRWFAEEMFPGALIAGVDYERRQAAADAFAELDVPPEWYVIAAQESPDLAATVTAATGVDGWDLVVDDASHEPARTAMTLQSLWPLVTPGGCYVIEDWSHAGMILGAFAERLVRELDEREIGRPYNLDHVRCISYLPGLIVINKGQPS
jgi:predicted O-methyltransferase YrrM